MHESAEEDLRNVFLRFWREEYNASQHHYLRTYLYSLLRIGRQGHGSIRNYFMGLRSIEDIRRFQRERKDPGPSRHSISMHHGTPLPFHTTTNRCPCHKHKPA